MRAAGTTLVGTDAERLGMGTLHPGWFFYTTDTQLVYVVDESSTWVMVPGGVDEFTDLTDVPATYVGSGGFQVRVNALETALEFVDDPTLPATIAAVLTDHDAAAHDALSLDHGSLSGLADDDHTQYPQAAGVETIGGQWTFSEDLRSSGELALNGQTTALMRMNSLSLADEASGNMRSDAGLEYGIIIIVCSTEVSVCVAGYDNASGFYIISDPRNLYRTTDTDTFHCLLVAAGNAQIKNRRGGARDYRIHMLGM